MKRVLSEQEAEVFKCRHHDFGGLSTAETARRLSIPPRTVRGIMDRVKEKCPQLFPVLTGRQAECYNAYAAGETAAQIAERLGISEAAVTDHLRTAKAKGVPFTDAMGKMLSYHPGMDERVSQKF